MYKVYLNRFGLQATPKTNLDISCIYTPADDIENIDFADWFKSDVHVIWDICIFKQDGHIFDFCRPHVPLYIEFY